MPRRAGLLALLSALPAHAFAPSAMGIFGALPLRVHSAWRAPLTSRAGGIPAKMTSSSSSSTDARVMRGVVLEALEAQHRKRTALEEQLAKVMNLF